MVFNAILPAERTPFFHDSGFAFTATQTLWHCITPGSFASMPKLSILPIVACQSKRNFYFCLSCQSSFYPS
jgi:hypothetical protein